MKFKSINFTCKNCGGALLYAPKSSSLECPFCSSNEPIEKSNQQIKEHDFDYTLKTMDIHSLQKEKREIKCTKCSAPFELNSNLVSSICPYCETPAITEFIQKIAPESILPFSVTHKEAQAKFREWIGSLWLAPKELKEFVDGHQKLIGFYIPYWTYDSQTTTRYSGERGDVYYVTVQKRVIIDGKEQIVNEREARINWTPVSGIVYNSFDDITIGASKTISNTLLDSLAPWDTHRLIPLNKKYLSGFNSEEYTITVDRGFDLAKIKMDRVIYQTIKQDIGGDEQRVNHKNIEYHNSTYKYTLLPIWTAKFKWKNKTYDYAINAQTGKVVGERPYSWIKIIFLVIFIAIILGGIVWYLEEYSQYI